MPAGFFDSGALFNHSHTSVPGDGGLITNLAVTGTISATGNISTSAGAISAAGNISTSAGTVSEAVAAVLSTDVPTLAQLLVFGGD